MGGNALKHLGVERVDTKTLKRAINQIAEAFYAHGIVWAVPASIESKETHGDLDIIVVGKFRDKVREIVKELDSLKNGPVDSVAWPYSQDKLLQVDFIFIPEEEYEYAVNYFCFNDLGNLVGRFAHKMGLKHGHDGLTLVVRDKDTVLGEIILTRDFKTALEFIGFSHDRYLEGFKTLDEIYTYVSNHPKFSPRMFDLLERNHTARMRDKKRPTYTGFLQWIEKNRRYLGDYDWPVDKSSWFPHIFSAFPDKQIEFILLWDAHRAKETAKTKFNGVMVSQLTGLSEKPLGRLIQSFKEVHPEWVAYVNSTSQEQIDKEVLRLYHDIFGEDDV